MHPIYTKLKIFAYPEKVRSLPRTSPEILAPLHVRLKPTNVCNHSCWYCAYRFDELQLGQDIDLKDSIPRLKMLEIVDDLVEMKVRAVTFSGGGEPFVYRHLAEAAVRLTEGGVRVASLTNGSHLRGEAAEVFAHRATWIRVSIDGWDSGSYAKYRHVREDEFGKVMGNLRAFTKLGGSCRLGASIIVDNVNAPHVYELAAQLADVGVSSIKISPCIVSNDLDANNAYHTPFFSLVREQIEQCVQNLQSSDLEIFDAFHTQLHTFQKVYTWCPSLQVIPVIGADLNVYSCQDKAYNLDSGLLGSIANRRFKDFWFQSKDTFFGIDPSRDCNHHCVSHEKNMLIQEFLGADDDHGQFV